MIASLGPFASTIDLNNAYLFYYDNTSGFIYVGVNSFQNPQINYNKIQIFVNTVPVSASSYTMISPLTACYYYGAIHLFYVNNQGNIQQIISTDQAQTWSYGTFGSMDVGIWRKSHLSAIGGPILRLYYSDNGSMTEANYADTTGQWSLNAVN